MDTTKTITHVGLCAGYGGIELGLKRVLPTLRSVALCEIEAFACANLVAKMEAGLMDAAPIWTNLKTFPWAEFFDRVDILTGGYPCQPFSSAGKRLGAEDSRHLWPYIAAGITAMRPRICFFENVEGHITLGLSTVISDLEELGYTVSWGIFSAAEVGAPHQRKRMFILANRADNGFAGRLFDREAFESPKGNSTSRKGSDLANLFGAGLEGDLTRLSISTGREMSNRSVAGGCGSSGVGELADSNSSRSGEDWKSSESQTIRVEQSSCFARRSDEGKVCEGTAWPSRPGEPQHAWEPPRVVGNAEVFNGAGQAGGQRETPSWRTSTARNDWQAQSPLGGDAHGLAGGLDYGLLCVSGDNRTDELRLLGNGVVPATAALAFKILFEEICKK